MKKLLVLLIIVCTLLTAPRTAARAQAVLSVEDILLMAAAMELENGMNSDLCLLYTGSVILNRVNSPDWPNSVRGVLYQRGQYAQVTLDRLYSVKVTERVMCLALKLATCGPLDDEIVFQSMHPELGRVKYKVDTDYFATGR